jgi:hypothetical protein
MSTMPEAGSSMPRDPFVRGLPSQMQAARADEMRLRWRDACSDARLAYLTWREAQSARAGVAFAAYVAAADREAAAADFLRRGGAPMLTPADAGIRDGSP